MATHPVSPGLANVMATVTSMYAIDRQMTTTAITRMHSDMPRPRSITSYGITDLEERRELFRQFDAICSKYNLGKPNTMALCLFLVLPKDRLETYLGRSTDALYSITLYEWFCATACTGLKVFLAKLPPGAIAGARSPTGNTSTAGTQLVRQQVAVQVSSPLTQPPMNVSPSPQPEPGRATRKRKVRDPDWDGPSARTRTRASRGGASRLSPTLPPVSVSVLPAPTNRPAPTTPSPAASRTVASPLTPPSLMAAVVPVSPFAPPSPTPSFMERSHAAVAAARARDNNRCVLTGHPLVQAAHIYPFSATKLAYYAASGASIQATTRHAAMGTLLRLWGDNLDATWRDACNNKAVSETAQNLICLDHYLHALWGRAYFGLEPVAQRDATALDGASTEIDIRFHWLYRGTRPPRDPVDDADDATVAAVCGRPGDPPLAPLAHRCSGVPLETGHVFTIRASSASELPSYALLEVQWHLTRLAAMSGAADVDDDDDDDGDDVFRAGDEDSGVWALQEDIFGNLLYDTDVAPLDLDAAETIDKATESGSP